MKPTATVKILTALTLLALPVVGSDTALSLAPPTTRQQTIHPVALPPLTAPVLPSNVPGYATYGYSAWQAGTGEDAGRRFDLMAAGYSGAANAARLLSYFSFSDIHITDKESPGQVPYWGWNAPFGAGGLYVSSYSPIILSTTQVLDAAVRTVNALHKQTPFDFGLVLGDDANSSQYNEIRWFIDVMDGRFITPSSGAHLGADAIDYQKPYQAAGLDPSIPWYDVIGNHDQFWMGVGFPSAKIQSTLIGGAVLNMYPVPLATMAAEGSGMYMGVVDGSTPYGDVIDGGPTAAFPSPPTVAADPDRRSTTIDVTSPTNFTKEFFNTTSSPVGHGFSAAGAGSTAGCYSFEPRSGLPLKLIVLDDTCKSFSPTGGALYFGAGRMDAARYAWLTNELQAGQDADQLMILATHIPVCPQNGLFDTGAAPQQFYDSQSEKDFLAFLHGYPNLIMLMAGHRHMSVATPQPSPDPSHPEYGFWEVETPSLRDFPQQFRTWEVLRNSDNTISILATDVDPREDAGSVAAKSRAYAIGAARVFAEIPLTDTTSHAYNAELVKQLSPAMQAKIGAYGEPVGRLASMSGQSWVAAGTGMLTAGFVVPGDVPRQFLIRGVGPALVPLGIPSALTQPVLTVHDGNGNLIASNTGWGANSNAAQVAAAAALMGDFALSEGSADSALLLTLAPGVYTAEVSGANNTSGIARSEVVEVNSTDRWQMGAAATRGEAGAGDNVLTARFSIDGSLPLEVLIRGVGPALARLGFPDAVRQPVLQVYDSTHSLVAANIGWGNNANSADIAAETAAVGEFPLPAGSADCALLVTLPPGNYTAQISGLNGSTGVALAEIYEGPFGNASALPAALVVQTPLTVGTLAGQSGRSGAVDDFGTASQFSRPADAAVDDAGNVYVADTNNDSIRKITPAGVVSTLAGRAGTPGSADGSGSAAGFRHPSGLTVDHAGNVYVTDTDNETIRVISPTGGVTTLAGQPGTAGNTDGVGSAARFNGPSGIVTDAAGNLYVADTLSHTLRKIAPSGGVSTFAGTAGVSGNADGSGAAARFFGPQGLAVDVSGNLYVADTNNSTIRKVVASTGVVTTVAGLAGFSGAADGSGSRARFAHPSAVAVDSTGRLYVADTDNNTLREITPAGLVSTIAGRPGIAGAADGIGSAALFSAPTGVAVDDAGNIYVADTDSSTVRYGYFAAAVAITEQPRSQTATAGANVQFFVRATGKPAPTYKWSFNGAAISGATGSSLNLTNVQSGDAGNYAVTVTNAGGAVTSRQATLTVSAAVAGGGGGAPGGWFCGALALLAIARWIRNRR
jgi:metallophosphoesterase (TIGR03768 family)